MALLDFLKNKEEKEKAKAPKKASVAKKTEKGEKTDKKDASGAAISKNTGTDKKGFSYSIIQEPHISEKASVLTESNKYTFKVHKSSNKLEIKKSIEGIYGVTVLDVNMIKIPHKKRRLGRTEGFKKAFVKAIVTVKAGQKIEIF